MCVSTVTISPRPSSASNIGNARAQANVLLKRIERINGHVQFLSQKYDLAQIKLHRIANQITDTKAFVATIKRQVKTGNRQLRADAVFAYVTNGASASTNPLFNTNASKLGATNVYNRLAEGDVGTTLASLKTYRIELTQERGILAAEVGRAASASRAAASAFHSSKIYQASLNTALHQVKGQIATFIAQAQAAAVAASQRTLASATSATNASVASSSGNYPAPPPDSKANIAIDAALSYIGVWYSWGGASRAGVDCSGLIMLAYEAAGVYLPHYSGAQYADTERVPLYDIQPGDILFYGYGGDEHEALYLGGGKMIEAEMTGTQVHIVPVRLDYGFFGLGRVRA